MAFDLILQKHKFWFNKNESIGDFEDEFLPFCSENNNYPMLDWLGDKFYDGPFISFDKSEILLKELSHLQNHLPKELNKDYIHNVLERLIIFFQQATSEQLNIQCISD